MIEVPPPWSFDGRCLRYGMMTYRQYLWLRAKWVFVSVGFSVFIAGWEFSQPPLGFIIGPILLVASAVNLWLGLRWRNSWLFWRWNLDVWLLTR